MGFTREAGFGHCCFYREAGFVIYFIGIETSEIRGSVTPFKPFYSDHRVIYI
jgi:hypothetical protein